MYPAPSSRPITSWTGRGAGLAIVRIVRPSTAPPATAAAPRAPAVARTRRRPGSVGADIRATAHAPTSATERQTTPVTTPSRTLPASPTASAVRPPVSASPTIVARRLTPPSLSHEGLLARSPGWTAFRTNSGAGRVGRLGPLAVEVQEGQRHDGRGDGAALALDRPFDRDARSRRREILPHGAEPDHLLDRRSPHDRRGASDLHPRARDRHGVAVDQRRDPRREAVPRVHR